MQAELARLAGVLLGLLHVVAPKAASGTAKQEQKLRFGVAAALRGEVCIAVEGPELPANTTLTVIDTESLPRLFTFVVDAPVENCPLLKSQDAVGTQYRAHLAEGELPSGRLTGIAVVGKFAGRGGQKDFTLNLGPTLPKVRVSTCTSTEGLYLNLWSAVPRKSTLLWQVYWYLGFETEPTCKRADYRRPKPSPR
jgi:hypothetical protein